MRMTKENAGKLYTKAGEDLLKAGLRNQLPNSVIMRFWDVVSDVADRSKYAEGAEISAEDLNSLCDAQNDIMAEFSDNIVTSWGALDEDELAKADSRSAFMLLNDYLFAYALKELGCEIPANFGRRGELNVTNAIKTTNSTGKQAAFEATENEVSFSRQRRKDSDVLKRELGGLETALSEKNPSALQVAKYLGEYRALKMRQENHTRFWKFFHRGVQIFIQHSALRTQHSKLTASLHLRILPYGCASAAPW